MKTTVDAEAGPCDASQRWDAGDKSAIARELGDERGRLRAMERMQILDAAPEAPFETIVQLVRQVLDVPICTVSVLDVNKQCLWRLAVWTKRHRA